LAVRKKFPSTSSWKYKLDAPKGVNGRNSENTLIEKTLGWEPNLPLRKGMEKTYAWIYDEMIKGNKGK
jgi:dTDP-D-glucose 4,6-dehydratase